MLVALGTAVEAKKAQITWKTFLTLNSLLKYFTYTKKQFLTFWMNMFNPKHLKSIPKTEFIDFVEKVVRGAYTENQTLVSLKFS